MLDEYYRNGKVFLTTLIQRDENNYQKDFNDYLKQIDDSRLDNLITDEFIKDHYKEPIKELIGNLHYNDSLSEKDLIKILGKYFEISGKTKELVNSTFFNIHNGKCSYCGEDTQIFSNRAFIFPFERKIDSISPEDARIQFCKSCGFILYCGMAYLYKKTSNLEFFFDSYDLSKIKRINERFKELKDPNNYNEIKDFKIKTYHPHETVLNILFEFAKELNSKPEEYKEILNILNDIKLILIIGNGQIYEVNYIEGHILNKFIRFFNDLIEIGRKKRENLEKIDKEKFENLIWDEMIFSGFFKNLELRIGKLSDNLRKRDEFSKDLLNGKFNFIVLNEIIMERIKEKINKYVFPLYYRELTRKYLEVFGLDKQNFERINSLGYGLGKKIKDTNLDSYIWEIFRARGPEEFYSSIVELQTKLEISLDLRAINENEKNWKETKAILINGILNALYGGV